MNSAELSSLVRACAARNHGIVMTEECLEQWVDGLYSLTTFGGNQGAVSLNRRGELGFVVHPRVPRSVLSAMISFIKKLSVPNYAHILVENKAVLNAALRMGYTIIGGTDRSCLLRRN